MAARTGNELLASFKVGGTCRYATADGAYSKAEVIEIFAGKVLHPKKKVNGVRLVPSEGEQEGKTLFIPTERLKGVQGRPVGYSPKVDSPAASPVAEKKPSNKKASANKAKEVEAETYDLPKVLEEMSDLIDEMQGMAERFGVLKSFLENLEPVEEESDEEPEPAPKASTKKPGSRSKPAATRRHPDEDED